MKNSAIAKHVAWKLEITKRDAEKWAKAYANDPVATVSTHGECVIIAAEMAVLTEVHRVISNRYDSPVEGDDVREAFAFASKRALQGAANPPHGSHQFSNLHDAACTREWAAFAEWLRPHLKETK